MGAARTVPVVPNVRALHMSVERLVGCLCLLVDDKALLMADESINFMLLHHSVLCMQHFLVCFMFEATFDGTSRGDIIR